MIKFGTSGWRGLIARDFTFDNVRLATQGIALYLAQHGTPKTRTVILGYDTRFLGKEFSLAAAEVLAGNGLTPLLCNRDTPTPVIAHTIRSRNALGGIVSAQRFAGGPNPEGEGWVPNITQKGLGEYSDKDIAYLLETGQTPDGDSVGGSMTAVIRNTSQLTPEDRAAMAAYIKALPPVEGPKKPEKAEKK